MMKHDPFMQDMVFGIAGRMASGGKTNTQGKGKGTSSIAVPEIEGKGGVRR
jgi:hypothetical protein